MLGPSLRRLGQGVTFFVLAAAGAPAGAQEPAKVDRWQDTAEFSYVVTAGNSETNTLGFKNKLWRAWESSSLEFNAGGVRAESTVTTDIFAVGTPGNFDVEEEQSSDLTAESYYLNGRYDRKITDRFFWFGAAGWDRNRFAGIDNRYTGVGGVGNIWVDTETVKFRTDYALTYTKEQDVVDNPDFDDTFLGARAAWNYLHTFGKNTTYTNDLIVDDNLDETADWRGNMINGLTVTMNTRLALKVGLQWLYDNRPAFREVDLYDIDPSDPASVLLGTVLEELDELDTIFTTSLVVNF